MARRGGLLTNGQLLKPGHGQLLKPGHGQLLKPGYGPLTTPEDGQGRVLGDEQAQMLGDEQCKTPGDGWCKTPEGGRDKTPGDGPPTAFQHGQTARPENRSARKRRAGRRPARALPLTAVALLLASAVPAQEGGLQATLDLSETFRLEDNRDFVTDPGDPSAILRTDITGRIASTTRSTAFALEAGAALDAGAFGGADGDGAELERYFGALSFGRESRDTALDFSARYTVSDVDPGASTSDLDIQDSVTAAGERQALNLAAGLEVGRTAGIGAAFGADYRRRIYDGTDDPDLFDIEETGIDATLFLRPRADSTVRLFARARRYEAENTAETRRDSSDIGLGLDQALTKTLSFSGSASYTRIETRETGVTDTATGVSATATLTRTDPRGVTRLTASSRVEATGQRLSAELGRNFTLKTGALDVSAGISTRDGTDPRPLAALSYAQEFRTRRLQLALTQRVTTTAERDELLTSRARLSLRHALTPVTAVDLTASFIDVTVISGDGTARRDLRLGAQLSRDLTADWRGVLGYEYRLDQRDDLRDRQSNTLFLGLERTFTLRRP